MSNLTRQNADESQKNAKRNCRKNYNCVCGDEAVTVEITASKNKKFILTPSGGPG